VWQKSVLLGFIEAMNLIHKQYRGLAKLFARRCTFDHFLYVR
jgi:hypothetical protein